MRDEDERQLEMFQYDQTTGRFIPTGLLLDVDSTYARQEKGKEKDDQSSTENSTEGSDLRSIEVYEDACLYIG